MISQPDKAKMKDNDAPPAAKPDAQPQALKDIVSDEIRRGAMVGLFRFAQKHGFNIDPCDKCAYPGAELFKAIEAEFTGGKYQFKESFKELVTKAAEDDAKMIFLVYDPNDDQHVRGLCRIIGASVILTFLERNKLELATVLHEIKN